MVARGLSMRAASTTSTATATDGCVSGHFARTDRRRSAHAPSTSHFGVGGKSRRQDDSAPDTPQQDAGRELVLGMQVLAI